MKKVVKKRRLGLLPASLMMAFLLLLIIVTGSSIPQAYGFTVVNRSICKGWTEKGEPVVTSKFSITDEKVYLYFNISWVDVNEYEQKWGTIPTFQRGLASASSITESFNLKTLRIVLTDPSQAEVNTFYQRTIRNVTCKPPGCISSAFLEILSITNTTKNGRWKLKWYDGSALIFTEEFVVGEEEGAPEQTFLEKFGLWIVVILAVVVVVAAVAIYFVRGKRKAAETAEPTTQNV